jgi:Mn2+/Fe2+ NRAMP family transporter
MAVRENIEDGGPETPPWANLGAGLITGAADDDPSGIATYSQVGAAFGYGMLWCVFLTMPLMIAMMLMGSHRRVMGEFTMPWPLKLFGWLATAAMATAVVAMFVMWGK